MIQAKREYIDAVYDEVERRYGTFPAFLSEGLGFSEKKQEEFRDLFLI